MAVRTIRKKTAIRKNGKGFTLVEMIVVLVVLSILAASGVGTALAYVRRSAFDQNEKNAATVYQTVQSSLQQLEKSGKISEWVEKKLIAHGKKYPASTTNEASNADLEASFSTTKYDQFNTEEHPAKANDSVHMRYVLRYYKKSTADESNDLKNLIKAYYSDEVIFQGSISVEFDVEKGIDAYKRIHYTAKCLSVFFDSRNDSGWGDDAVPLRSYDKRKDTLIGYYDGYKGTSVDTVYLPQVQEA